MMSHRFDARAAKTPLNTVGRPPVQSRTVFATVSGHAQAMAVVIGRMADPKRPETVGR